MGSLDGTVNRFGIGIVGLGDGGTSNLRSLTAIGQREGVMQGDRIGVGISDTDDEGRCNALAFAGLSGVEVVALCDTNGERLERVAAELGKPVAHYRDSAELVADPNVDLVVVATPDHEHLGLARQALEAGKHVFVEKPVATSLADLEAFRELVQRFPGRLWFGEKYSYARPVEAALARREALGPFLWGSTLYSMWRCGRIMGGGKWRTESAYNPCAGGLSHNFMTALLFADAPIHRIQATGQVLTYHENLDRHGGFDTMDGTLEFSSGRRLSWVVCLAVQGDGSPLAHRTISHTFQFKRGVLAYGPTPEGDRLIVDGKVVPFRPEPPFEEWGGYSSGTYCRMHTGILAAIRGGKGKLRHTIEDGINVAAACVKAFESAKQDGVWLDVPF